MSDTAVLEAPRLKKKYHDEVKGSLKEQLGLTNVMQVPTLEKIVLNMGVGRATQQPSLLKGAVRDLTAISRPEAARSARPKQVGRRFQGSRGPVESAEGHALRRPDVGVPRPADLGRHPAHPRLPRPAGDQLGRRGNYTFGLNEQTVFPEIDYDKVDSAARHGHHPRHHRHHRRPGQGAARRVRLPVPARRSG